MCKCDWCKDSKMKDGKLVCPYTTCWMKQSQIDEILRNLARAGKYGRI